MGVNKYGLRMEDFLTQSHGGTITREKVTEERNVRVIANDVPASLTGVRYGLVPARVRNNIQKGGNGKEATPSGKEKDIGDVLWGCGKIIPAEWEKHAIRGGGGGRGAKQGEVDELRNPHSIIGFWKHR